MMLLCLMSWKVHSNFFTIAFAANLKMLLQKPSYLKFSFAWRGNFFLSTTKDLFPLATNYNPFRCKQSKSCRRVFTLLWFWNCCWHTFVHRNQLSRLWKLNVCRHCILPSQIPVSDWWNYMVCIWSAISTTLKEISVLWKWAVHKKRWKNFKMYRTEDWISVRTLLISPRKLVNLTCKLPTPFYLLVGCRVQSIHLLPTLFINIILS